ncbi:MAG: cupin domain-containing protein [Candidatus Latescibacterota bacterium]
MPLRPAVLPYQLMITHVDGIAATATAGRPHPLFQAPGFATSWRRFELLDLPPAGVFTAESQGQELGYLVLSGCLLVEQSANRVEAQAPGAIRCAVGVTHRAVAGAEGARLLCIAVDAAGASGGGELAVDGFARDRLPWRDAVHGGGGRIGTRHLWRPEDFVSSWTFVDHAMLSEGSSLGCHYHDHLEEAFVVLSGRGWMTIGDATVEIGAGAVTLQRANIGHGLYNPFAEELDFIRVAVSTPDGTFTTIDLDDDLRERRPTR